ncbi:MAG TPA: ROK family protein [Flavisolibacter sp.]|nr:ROK family protein [Flavisolibacter sp.]
MCNSIVAGVDIGGSHITVALIDMEKGEVLKHTWKRSEVNAQSSASTIIDNWSKAIEESVAAHNSLPCRLGIAMPGPFNYEEGISLMQNQNKFDALYGLNVKQLLLDNLQVQIEQITMTNDAACYLKGEVYSGAAKGCNRALGITLGTGLGSARSINRVVEDANLWCSPFKEGIAEDYLSSRWFVNRYAELTGIVVKDVKTLVDKTATNPIAQQIVDEFGQNLGTFLLPYVVNDAVETVVLGGNIANAYPLFSQALKKVLLENGCTVEIKQTLLGENAILVGAASYCLKHEEVELLSIDIK